MLDGRDRLPIRKARRKSSSVRFLKFCQGTGGKIIRDVPMCFPRAMNICSVPIPSPVTLSGVRFAANDTPMGPTKPSCWKSSRRSTGHPVSAPAAALRLAAARTGTGACRVRIIRPHFLGGMAVVGAGDADRILPPVDGIGRGRGRGGVKTGKCLGNACYGATRAMVLGSRVPDFTGRSRMWAVAVQVDRRSITSWTPASPRESSITIAVGT